MYLIFVCGMSEMIESKSCKTKSTDTVPPGPLWNTSEHVSLHYSWSKTTHKVGSDGQYYNLREKGTWVMGIIG